MHVLNDGDPRPDLTDAVVVVGELDGVHLGHQRVLAEARSTADASGGPVVAVVVERPGAGERLCDHDGRLALLDAAGVDVVRVVTDVPASLPDLLAELGAAAYVCGDDRASDAGDVKTVTVATVRTDDGEAVTADRLRRLVVGGDVAGAVALLGRPYELRGIVEHGDARGRTIGFPTANVAVAAEMALPADGVYAGWYVDPAGVEHVSAINIGRRPTFYDENGVRLVEAHLLDFDGDLYDQLATVRFAQRLREEVRFDGLDALKAQLARDVASTRDLLL